MHYVLAAAVGLALAGGCTGNSAANAQAAHEGKRHGGGAPPRGGKPAAERTAKRLAAKTDGGEPAERGAARAEDLARNYERLQLMTDKAVPVDQKIFYLCYSPPIAQAAAKARKRAGPHAMTTLRVFMNDSAAAAFLDSAKRYPARAVIIKEKRGLYDAGKNKFHDHPETVLGVAGMIKRAAGYDPEHGDWEYFYSDEASKITQGKIASCIECHRQAAKSDYVFGDWAFGGQAEEGEEAGATDVP